MSTYRKKPVEIQAWRNIAAPPSATRAPEWLTEAISDGRVTHLPNDQLVVNTLEGHMVASVGDWIIRGVAGELYPCKPEIFAATYEPVVVP